MCCISECTCDIVYVGKGIALGCSVCQALCSHASQVVHAEAANPGILDPAGHVGFACVITAVGLCLSAALNMHFALLH